MQVTVAELHRALERDEVVPYFQPLVDLRTGRVTGFEVLARWLHPDLGPVLPSNFIALSEENGLIGAMTRQVFQRAFAMAADMPGSLGLAVNISPVQLRYRSLCNQIKDLASAADFELDRLTIEITESAILEDLESARKSTLDLKGIGCKLALDDFGTGYSSLRHLQALPFDQVKIDRSFVSGMVKRRESRKIVATIVGLAHTLDLSTVAEGIETEEQADILLLLGCQLGQGWLYGKAEPASRLPDLIAAAPKPALQKDGFGDKLAVSSLEALPSQRLAQLQAIYDGVPVGLCFLDRNLRYVSINRRLADMNGMPVSAFLGRTVKEMIPNLFPSYEPYLLRALEGEAITGAQVVRPASEPGQMDRLSIATYQPAWDEAGEVIGLSVAVLDVTEQEETRQKVRASALRPELTRAVRPAKRLGTVYEINARRHKKG